MARPNCVMPSPAFGAFVLPICAADRFAVMEGATNGDWTHGLLHPGPGVTSLPLYNAAHEVMAFAERLELDVMHRAEDAKPGWPLTHSAVRELLL